MDTASSEYAQDTILYLWINWLLGFIASCTWNMLILIQSVTSRYIFCDEFFGEESLYYDIFAGNYLACVYLFQDLNSSYLVC